MLLDTRAVVEKVDQNTREVRLRTMDGKELTVLAGPEVRNLAQVSAGDTVRLTYYESVAARMAEPGAGGPATTSVIASRAPEGSKPAGSRRRHNRYGGRVPRLRPGDGRRHLQDAGGQ